MVIKRILLIVFFLSMATHAMGATYYMRADGTALSKAEAIGPASDAGACMSISVHNAETFSPGDMIYLSDRGGTYTDQLNVPTAGTNGNHIVYRNVSGETPLFGGSGQYHFNCAMNDSYITIDGIAFTGGSGSPSSSVRFSRNVGNVIQNCAFSGVTAGYAIYIWSDATGGTNTIQIIDNTFSNNAGAVNIYVEHSNETVHTMNIQGNTFNGGLYALRVYGAKETIGPTDKSPYNIQIIDNTVSNTEKAAFQFETGIDGYDGTSLIARNTLTNIGNGINPRINAMQLQWCRGLVVEDNVINGVHNNFGGDGDGIILDWAWHDNDYISDRCIVRRNKVTGCNESDNNTASGITFYKTTNSTACFNISYGNTYGFRLANIESTGNIFCNNTAYNNTHGAVRLDDPGFAGGAPESTWQNNIFHTATYGIIIANGSANPIESCNLFYNCATNIYDGSSLPIDSTDLTMDPQLDATTYVPGLTELFFAGTAIDGVHKIAALQADYDGTHIAPYMIPIGAQGYERPPGGIVMN